MRPITAERAKKRNTHGAGGKEKEPGRRELAVWRETACLEASVDLQLSTWTRHATETTLAGTDGDRLGTELPSGPGLVGQALEAVRAVIVAFSGLQGGRHPGIVVVPSKSSPASGRPRALPGRKDGERCCEGYQANMPSSDARQCYRHVKQDVGWPRLQSQGEVCSSVPPD